MFHMHFRHHVEALIIRAILRVSGYLTNQALNRVNWIEFEGDDPEDYRSIVLALHRQKCLASAEEPIS